MIIKFRFFITTFALLCCNLQTKGQEVNPNDFTMYIISDPQFPWACPSTNRTSDGKPAPKCDDKKRAASDNVHQVHWILNHMQKLKDPKKIGGLIMNGDLTAFGHEHEFKTLISLWMPLISRMDFYPGLGNHDYQNNVNDCYENNCATRMTQFMIDYYLTKPKLNQSRYPADFKFRKYYKFPSNHIEFRGSMSYSWDIGKIHFVQLHNHPYYKTSWDSWNHPKALRNHYYIEPSIEWLKKDLTLAKEKNKKIIINLHDHQRVMFSQEFKKILKDYNVSAIFAGHLHSQVGQVKFPNACDDPSIGMPCFLSGGAAYRSVLAVHFKEGDLMTVEAYRGKQHPPKLDPPYIESTNVYQVKLKS